MNLQQTIRTAVRVTHLIDELPAIPTQDWVSRCAGALSILSERAAAISLVCSLNPEMDRIVVYSSGVEVAPWTDSPDEATRVGISLQDRSERLNKLGFRFPEHTRERGLVAPLSAITQNWTDTTIGRALSSAQLTDPLIQLVPVSTEDHSLCLLNIIGFTKRMETPQPAGILHMLVATHAPLRMRAQAALQNVNNPRAWLTDREQGVLDLLIEGHSVRVIAEKLGRSAHTIHDHVKNLHKKIDASSRGELIAKALGHTCDESGPVTPQPLTMGSPSEPQLTELKPSQLTAKPLRR